MKEFCKTIISNIHQINKIRRNEINWIFLQEVKTGWAGLETNKPGLMRRKKTAHIMLKYKWKVPCLDQCTGVHTHYIEDTVSTHQ